MSTQTIDFERIKDGVNILDVARSYTALRELGAGEYHGPCPICKAGDDRFWVTPRDRSWGSRCTSHKQGGDVIDLVSLVEGITLGEAARRLSGAELPKTDRRPLTPDRKETARGPEGTEPDQWLAERVPAWAGDLINSPDAEGARRYLVDRGLGPGTWRAFSLGFRLASLPFTEGKIKAPAVVIPWFWRTRGAWRVHGVRYRFLETHKYTDVNGRERETKIGGRGSVRGLVFGLQSLPDYGELPADYGKAPIQGKRTLVICEGEINAMSIWQTFDGAPVDVLSLGSQGQGVPDGIAKLAALYRSVILWLDEPDQAARKSAGLPKSYALRSPVVDLGDGKGKGPKDANDCMASGWLSPLLARAMIAAADPADLEAVLWDLYDLESDDPRVVDQVRGLASQLGRSVSHRYP